MASNMIDSLEAEFASLIEQHDVAWEKYRSQQAIVSKKFSLIVTRHSSRNPSLHELDAEDRAWSEVVQIKSRIDEVIQRLQSV
jgi:ArsR family metal-binding transcriptional regulator